VIHQADCDCSETPALLQRLIKPHTLAPDGRYDVELFHPVDEEWVTVSVDDRLAVAPVTGAVQFMQAHKQPAVACDLQVSSDASLVITGS